MAWLTDSGLLIISLVALIAGLVTGLIFESGIRKRLDPIWLRRLHITLLLAPFLMMVSTSRFPFTRTQTPPSLAEEQAARARLPDSSLSRQNSNTFRSEPPLSAIQNPPVQSYRRASPQSSTISSFVEYTAVEPVFPEAITRLVISSLGVDTSVKLIPFKGYTWDLSDLNQDVAWLEIPTDWETTEITLLAGHITLGDASNGPFRYLFLLTSGEQIKVYTSKSVTTYSITDQKVVNTNDLSIISTAKKGQLFLLTCTDWDELAHTYRQRRVVFADLVAVDPLIRDSDNPMEFH